MVNRIVFTLVGLIILAWLAVAITVAPHYEREWVSSGLEISTLPYFWIWSSSVTSRLPGLGVCAAIAAGFILLPWTTSPIRDSSRE